MGLERAGMKTMAFCEKDKHARKVLRKHWPDTPIHEDVCSLKGWEGQFDVICGGFPCQDISIAGKGKGLKGERSGLWKEYARLIEEIKPRYAIIENVANLRAKGLATVMQDLWKIGYDCEWHIISASSIGALHQRERIWIIAYPNSSKLREQSGRGSREEREGTALLRVNGKERIICDTSGERFDGHIREGRHIQTDEEWNNKKAHSEGTQCQLVPRQNGQILSKWAIESIRNTYAEQWELVSRVHRVVNGLSKEVERSRKQRIKQLGNSVVPQIPELIGKEIMQLEEI